MGYKAWVMMMMKNEDKTECNLELYPLITCGVCKHYDKESGICNKGHSPGPAGNWYCADGEEDK